MLAILIQWAERKILTENTETMLEASKELDPEVETGKLSIWLCLVVRLKDKFII
jgi:hypothetical protein